MKHPNLLLCAPILVAGLLPACGNIDPTMAAPEDGVGGGSSSTAGGADAAGGADTFATSTTTTGPGGGTDGSGGGEIDTSGCGDGLIQSGEACDDGNSTPGDGCSADCTSLENGFACPTPGQLCVSTVVCGDGVIKGAETCDDSNTTDGDGCDSSCAIESGWKCATPGTACSAVQCGDGIIAGNEECEDDDATATSGDGCSDTCQRELGYACPGATQACYLTTCNDGIKEGDEPCDDGNQIVGDGCNPFCQVEPSCNANGCTSSCGDGMILSTDNEECDDGNTNDGDGCSSSCKVENGFTCNNVLNALPDSVEVPIIFRDFIAFPTSGNVRHPDFEIFTGGDATTGLVENTLDANGKPVYTGTCEATQTGTCDWGQQTTSKENFQEWYNDSAASVTVIQKLTLNKEADANYLFDSDDSNGFFPVDGIGQVGGGNESAAHNGHNYGFTSEIRSWFEYKGGEELHFSGDDDVWVFINGRLALDLGGLHPARRGSVNLDAKAAELGLQKSRVYEIALFHAERRFNGSNFKLTLGGFVSAKSECSTDCGDGIVAGDELCDDGVNDGSYGGCTDQCTPAASCGDATVQTAQEACDDGINLTTYSSTGAAECAPGCVDSAYCGDNNIDSLFGEQCDDGTLDGSYGGCNDDCSLGPRCGDNVVQQSEGESCDDGNTVGGDGCSAKCQTDQPK